MRWLSSLLGVGRWRIQRKIVVPFTGILICVAAIAAVTTLVLFNRYTDREVDRTLRRWLATVTTTGYIQYSFETEDKLRSLKSGLGVDVIGSYANGMVASGTLDQSSWTPKQVIDLEELLREAVHAPSKARTFHAPGMTYRLIHGTLDPAERGVVLVTLMAPMSDVEAARRRMAVAVGVVTAAGILLVTLIGSGIARAITGPIAELVRGTQRLADGDLDEPVEVTTQDEIGQLADAFNRMTEQLRHSQESLIEAERLATAAQMAATFAHEIRNPLSSIRMMMQLAAERTTEPKTLQYIENTIEEIDRLNSIVEEMLEFSNPTAGNFALCDARTVLKGVLDLMDPSMEHHGIDVDFSAPQACPVRGDADALTRAFLNLLLNAVQAQPQGGRIDASALPDDGHVRVVIADRGPGFSKDALESLFRPFATTKTRGSGLGLVTSKRIIEHHGGEIRVGSRPDGGAEVTVLLPLKVSATPSGSETST